MTYYVTRGPGLYTKSGNPIDEGMKKFDNIDDARAYAIKLASKYQDKFGYFIDPKTKKRWEVGLGVVFISKSMKGKEIGTILYGQPNLKYLKGWYWHTVTGYESHWSLLNKNGTIKKKYR